jgi:hypothetical protein
MMDSAVIEAAVIDDRTTFAAVVVNVFDPPPTEW